MNIRERQRSYKDAVEKSAAVTETTRFADAFGVSNSAKVIERGLFAFNANFNSIGPDHDQLVMHCLLRFPPEDEIFLSLFVKSELPTFRQRLDEMRAAGSSRSRGAAREADEDDDSGDEEAAGSASGPAASP